jgi:hypothetical protein
MSTSCSCEQSVSIYQKRSLTLKITITGPGDLTDYKIWFSVKQYREDTDVDALITKKSLNNGGADTEAKVVDGPNGIIEVYIVPTDTDGVTPGDYLFDVVLESPTGSRMQAITPSNFSILRPITVTT